MKGIEMETMTQPKIAGYRQLTEAEVALMNEGKALAEQCGIYIAKLRAYVPQNMEGPEGGDADAFKPGASLDQRWIAIGATDIQKGWMSVIRGIAQPTTF
jgi:hypothetical protein